MASKSEQKRGFTGRKLTTPFDRSWPQLRPDVDSQIVDKLRETFSPLKCLRQIKKSAPYWKKKKQKSDPIEDTVSNEGMEKGNTTLTTKHEDKLSPEEEARKSQIKSLLSVGANRVIKDLEKDKLRLVLVWRSCRPADLKSAFLSLCASTGCAAACISELCAPVSTSWEGLSSLTALGFKKTEDPNEFDDLVNFVKDVVPTISVPEVPSLKNGTVIQESVPPREEMSTVPPREEMSTESTTETKPREKNIQPPVDFDKFYIYKTTQASVNTFGGDFIQFGADMSVECIEVIDGKPELLGNKNKKGSDCFKAYSISSTRLLSNRLSHLDPVETNRKRKLVLSDNKDLNDSGYKSINVKIPNLASQDGNKKKKKKVGKKKIAVK